MTNFDRIDFGRAVMRILSLIFTILAAAWVAPAAAATEEGWRLEKDSDGIQIYTRAVEGWSIREIRAVTRIPARLSSVVAVIHDVPATRELNDLVSKADVQNRESDTRYRVYMVIGMPWPLSDRDVLNQREIKQDKNTFSVTISDVAVQDVNPPRTGLVRMVRSRQQWVLTPGSDGHVAVELRILTDPNGPIPASIINTMAVGAPFKTLSKLRELTQRAEYANAKLPFIKEAAGS
jgi:hypothetical protein